MDAIWMDSVFYNKKGASAYRFVLFSVGNNYYEVGAATDFWSSDVWSAPFSAAL